MTGENGAAGSNGAVPEDLLSATGNPVAANPVAAKLGKLGMPEPLSALAAKDWDAVVIGAGTQRTDRRRLSGPGRPEGAGARAA